MIKIVAVLAAMFISVSALAVSPVANPGNKTLNWCRYADGTVGCQADSCGPGTTPLGVCAGNSDAIPEDVHRAPGDIQPVTPPKYWCKYANGMVGPQNVPCGPDAVAIPSGVVLNEAEVSQATPAGITKAIDSEVNKNKSQMFGKMGDGLKHYGEIAGIALIVGLLAKLLGQSFWLWSILGLGVRYILVALNVIGS